MRVDELFSIKYGRRNFYFKSQEKGDIPYISSQSKNHGIMGYVKSDIVYENIITVARNGSVGTSFFHDYVCVPNDDCLILTAKLPLQKREHIYYCLNIQQHKGKFAYGRKVTPDRLGEIEIPSPDEIPSWVYEMEIPTFDDITEAKTDTKVELPPVSEWGTFRYEELFKIEKVKGPKISEVKNTSGNIPYVSATAENNGIACYGSFEPTVSGNCITIGHLGDCFYQERAFAGSNVTVLIPKFELNRVRGMFLVTLLNMNKFKYSYGRVIGITRLKKEIISLPILPDGTPNWQLMEDYINSLPYSKYL